MTWASQEVSRHRCYNNRTAGSASPVYETVMRISGLIVGLVAENSPSQARDDDVFL